MIIVFDKIINFVINLKIITNIYVNFGYLFFRVKFKLTNLNFLLIEYNHNPDNKLYP